MLPILLGAIHFLVDAASNFVVVGLLPSRFEQWFPYLVGYNALAFALQPVAGALADRAQRPWGTALLGVFLSAAALLPGASNVVLTVLLAGIGNSLFHVGAGILVANHASGRAGDFGVFIAPGALGVALGTVAARRYPALAFWPILAGLGVALPLLAYLARVRPTVAPARPQEPSAGTLIPALLLLLAIAMRALLGGRSTGPLGRLGIALPAAVAVFGGKAVGGFVADRFGWKRIAVSSLVISALLLMTAASGQPWLACLGLLCFQVVTGVTLAAVIRLFPGRPGLGFGLASFALFMGSLPVLLHLPLAGFAGLSLDSLLACLSALAIWQGLAGGNRLLAQPQPSSSEQKHGGKRDDLDQRESSPATVAMPSEKVQIGATQRF